MYIYIETNRQLDTSSARHVWREMRWHYILLPFRSVTYILFPRGNVSFVCFAWNILTGAWDTGKGCGANQHVANQRLLVQSKCIFSYNWSNMNFSCVLSNFANGVAKTTISFLQINNVKEFKRKLQLSIWIWLTSIRNE